MADLRDRLKLGLSEKTPEDGTPTTELAERIRELRASVTVEAALERVARRAVRAQRPVTARIQERRGEAVPEIGVAEPANPEAGQPPAPAPVALIALPEPIKAPVDYRQDVVKRRQQDEKQLRLW